jgi:hypothetical protein
MSVVTSVSTVEMNDVFACGRALAVGDCRGTLFAA